MTLVVRVGRRVPKSFMNKSLQKIKQYMNFQEELWLILKRSFNISRKKFQNGKMSPEGRMDTYDIKEEREDEDNEHEIQWLVMTIQGDQQCEKAEHDEAMSMYKDVKSILRRKPKIMKKEVGMQGWFKSKLVSSEKIEQAYEKGYGAKGDNSIQEILLEMNILTHIELIDDYVERGYAKS